MTHVFDRQVRLEAKERKKRSLEDREGRALPDGDRKNHQC